MACCGHGRGQMTMSGRIAGQTRGPVPVSSAVLYRYTGATGMTVLGPISGTRYRFDQPGAKLQIDRRDLSSMAGLPNLQRLG
jgi:hypothetical protein